MAYAFAVISSIVYGSADFLGGMASRKTSVLTVMALSVAVGLATILAVLPFFPRASVSAADIRWAIAAGFAGVLGLGLLYRALAIGPMSIAAPVTAVFSALVPVLAGIAQGERPTALAFCGVAVALVAIVLVSQAPPSAGRAGVLRNSIVVALVAGAFLGLFLICLDAASDEAGLWTLVIARTTSLALVLPFALVRGSRPLHGAAAPIIGAGMLDTAANVFYLMAVAQGMLAIVAALVSLYPAATVILARIVYRERLRLSQRCGVACAIAAVIMMVSG
jgi:drug/metabolite transporter (DMT)-like permease